MRKVFLCCMIVVMLICCAVPTFAFGSSGTDANVYYSVLPFDTVEFEDGSATYSYPFPFNSILAGSPIQRFAFYDDGISDFEVFFGYCGAADDGYLTPSIVGDMNFPMIVSPNDQEMTVTFKGGNKILDLDLLLQPDVRFEYSLSDARMNNSVFSCAYWTVEYDPVTGDYYKAKLHSASWTEGYYPNEQIDVVYCIRSALKNAEVGENGLVYLDNYSFTINFRRININTPTLAYFATTNGRTVPDSPSDFINWFDDLQLLTDDSVNSTDGLDIFSWITTGINSFLETEIVPGFSFNKILWLILVIGIMLWFITLLI